MSYGDHEHQWQFSEPRKCIINRIMKWVVIKFCTRCHEMEEIELIDIKK